MTTEAQAKRHFYYERAKADWKFYTMRLRRADYEKLKRVAGKRRRYVNELIRKYIAWGLEQEGRA